MMALQDTCIVYTLQGACTNRVCSLLEGCPNGVYTLQGAFTDGACTWQGSNSNQERLQV